MSSRSQAGQGHARRVRVRWIAACALLAAASACERGPQDPPQAREVAPAQIDAATAARPTAIAVRPTTSASSVHESASSSASASPTASASQNVSAFLGEPDQAIRAQLSDGKVIKVKKGTGGRSLAFKLTLDNGSEGYFKPEQTFSGTIWFAELVAYYLDRTLGMGRVPPVVGRRLSWSKLATAAGDDPRSSEVIVGADKRVRGALIAWLSKPPQPVHTPPGWENWIRIEPFSQFTITPFQRASEHGVALRAFRERVARGDEGTQYYDQTPIPERADLPASLSDMLVLDFLTLNIDRWGGGNGNVLGLGAGGPLVFLDNAAGFSRGPARRSLMDGRFIPCQRFRKQTIEALQRFDLKRFGALLASDPLGPLLDDELLQGIAVRREAVLAHVSALRARFGDEAVLAW